MNLSPVPIEQSLQTVALLTHRRSTFSNIFTSIKKNLHAEIDDRLWKS
jgi:hypothetical protein